MASSTFKIYENVIGLHIDIPLTDSTREEVPVASIVAQKFIVLTPGALEEVEWEATLVSPNIIRHTVPSDATLTPGKYKVQAYIETLDGYAGRCSTAEFTVYRKMK